MIVAAALAVIAVPPAQAATPFTAGTGDDPSLAVGSDGSGHVVWTRRGVDDRVGYCRVRSEGEACERTHELAFEAPAALLMTAPAVFTPAPNKVVIASSCANCNAGPGTTTFIWTSTNNGQSFGAPQRLRVFSGGTPLTSGIWLDELGSYVGLSSRVGASAGATLPTAGIDLTPTSGTSVFDPVIARVPGTDKLVAAVNDLVTIRYAVYTGAGSVAALNDPGNWLVDRSLPAPEGDNDETVLSSGPSGVFLSYAAFAPTGIRAGLRRFDPVTNTFGVPQYLNGDDPFDRHTFGESTTFQDPSGRMHVAWRLIVDGDRLRYRVGDPNTREFSPAANIALRERFVDPKLAAGADGKGFAVWDASSDAIRVVRLDPQPEPAPLVTATQPPAVEPPGACSGPDGDRDGIADSCELFPSGAIPPVAGRTGVVKHVSGEVLVRVPSRGAVFRPLKGIASIPIGSTINASKGVVEVQTAANGLASSSRGYRRQDATLRAGMFALRQARARRNRRARIATDFLLVYRPDVDIDCNASTPTRVLRKLTVKAAGRFRVIGAHSRASGRSATLTTIDRCAGTLTRVARGRVTVRRPGRRAAVIVGAGRSHMVRAKPADRRELG
jgi:hypothetical protein